MAQSVRVATMNLMVRLQKGTTADFPSFDIEAQGST
jgi:hypothetical protein